MRKIENWCDQLTQHQAMVVVSGMSNAPCNVPYKQLRGRSQMEGSIRRASTEPME
jgi:hypothetical protein